MKKLASLTGAAILGMGVLSIPMLALAAQPTYVELVDTGRLVARGAAVVVSVEIACTDDTHSTDVIVGVTQRVGNQITRGGGQTHVDNCSSTTQTVPVLVQPNEGSGRFGNGSALADAYAQSCDEFFISCGSLQDQEEIRIRK